MEFTSFKYDWLIIGTIFFPNVKPSLSIDYIFNDTTILSWDPQRYSKEIF